MEDILPSSTAPFIPFSPSSQFVSKETGLKGNEAPREEQPVKVAVTEEWRQSELVKRASALSAPHALRHEAVLSRTVKRLYSKPGPSKGAAAI